MAWTKGQIVLAALEEIGIASYIYDVQPDQMQSGLSRLNAMMASWNAQGIKLGYPIPSEQLGDEKNDLATIPDGAIEAVVANLAVKLAPSYGKQTLPETKIAAKSGYLALLTKYLRHQQIPINPLSVPRGSGYKDIYQRTWPDPDEQLNTGLDDIIEF